MRVVLTQSVVAIFQHPIDGMVLEVPDHFRPQVGDQMRIDHLKVSVGKTVPIRLFVVEVEWRLANTFDTRRNGEARCDAVMYLTVSSEMPAKPGTRRVHDNSKRG